MSAEIEINAQTFGSYIENLKRIDPRINNVASDEVEAPANIKVQFYTVSYESGGHQGEIGVGFSQDINEPEKPRFYVAELFKAFDDEVTLETENKIQDVIDWWDKINKDECLIFIGKEIIGERKFLSLGYHDLADYFYIEIIDSLVKEIIDNMPRVLEKTKEVGLLA